MTYITDETMDAVVFLFASEEDAQDGKGQGGSGFLVSIETPKGREYLYAVTNDHVIHRCPWVRLTSRGRYPPHILKPEWESHPDGDDLAIAPLGFTSQFLGYHGISRKSFLRKEWLSPTRPFGYGSEIFFLGRFLDREGREVNEPVARFGHIALSPPTEVYQDDRAFWQESFMVEARSVSGFSGSAVVVMDEEYGGRHFGFLEVELDVEPADVFGSLLLGIDWGHKSRSSQHSGMSYVVPAWKLAEMLDSEEHVAVRKKEDERLDEEQPKDEGAVLDFDSEEFERFERLAKGIAQVPKEEVDELRDGKSQEDDNDGRAP
jgi:hypothetical protein